MAYLMLQLKDQHRLHFHTVLEKITASVVKTGLMQIMDARESGAVITVAALRVRGMLSQSAKNT